MFWAMEDVDASLRRRQHFLLLLLLPHKVHCGCTSSPLRPPAQATAIDGRVGGAQVLRPPLCRCRDQRGGEINPPRPAVNISISTLYLLYIYIYSIFTSKSTLYLYLHLLYIYIFVCVFLARKSEFFCSDSSHPLVATRPVAIRFSILHGAPFSLMLAGKKFTENENSVIGQSSSWPCVLLGHKLFIGSPCEATSR